MVSCQPDCPPPRHHAVGYNSDVADTLSLEELIARCVVVLFELYVVHYLILPTFLSGVRVSCAFSSAISRRRHRKHGRSQSTPCSVRSAQQQLFKLDRRGKIAPEIPQLESFCNSKVFATPDLTLTLTVTGRPPTRSTWTRPPTGKRWLQSGLSSRPPYRSTPQ